MTANEEKRCLMHDTTMCGDPKVWFPMRVTYSRELKVKAELDRLEIENFVPMMYKLMDDDTDNPHRELVPAINNLIFVHSSQERIRAFALRVILMAVALGLKRKNRKSLINDRPQGVNWLQYYKRKEVL